MVVCFVVLCSARRKFAHSGEITGSREAELEILHESLQFLFTRRATTVHAKGPKRCRAGSNKKVRRPLLGHGV